MSTLASAVQYTATGGQYTFSGISAVATGNTIEQISIPVAASTTNQLYTISIIRSKLQSFFLYTDGALTLKTNSSGSPSDTFVFAAGYPFAWVLGAPFPVSSATPLAADVTAFYLTNSTGSIVNFYGIINQTA